MLQLWIYLLFSKYQSTGIPVGILPFKKTLIHKVNLMICINIPITSYQPLYRNYTQKTSGPKHNTRGFQL